MFPSVKAVESALCADCPNPAAKLLLVILASYVDARLQAFPSMALLRTRTGIKSERTVAAQLKALADAGLLRVEQDHAKNGRQTSNVYTLLVPVPGFAPAPEQDKPRRSHPHSIRRPVDKGGVKPGDRRPITPQNLRGHPAKSAGTYPAKSAPLEPFHNNQEAHAPAKAGVQAGDDSRPWKGKRYAAPAAPVVAVRRASEGRESASTGSAELDRALKALDEGVRAAAGAPARSRV